MGSLRPLLVLLIIAFVSLGILSCSCKEKSENKAIYFGTLKSVEHTLWKPFENGPIYLFPGPKGKDYQIYIYKNSQSRVMPVAVGAQYDVVDGKKLVKTISISYALTGRYEDTAAFLSVWLITLKNLCNATKEEVLKAYYKTLDVYKGKMEETFVNVGACKVLLKRPNKDGVAVDYIKKIK